MPESTSKEDSSEFDDSLERDKFCFELISDTYNSEKNRNNDIDGKASKLITFVGILVSLQSAFGTLLLKDVSSSFYYIYVSIFLIGLLFFIISIGFGLKAYKIQKWKDVPKTSKIIDYGKQDKDLQSIIRIISMERSKAVEKNKEKMKCKVNSIKLGFSFFLIGIITTFILILLILITNKL